MKPIIASFFVFFLLFVQVNANPNLDLGPFYHGVASGDPTASGFIIWTRVTPFDAPGPIEVSYFVATDLEFEHIVANGMALASPDKDYTLKVDINGLDPGTTYFYYFNALGRNSLVGRAKTCPDGAVDHLRFAVASCANFEGGYFNGYAGIAARNDLDAVIHLGDYIYEYRTGVYGQGPSERINDPLHEIVSLIDYRTRYALFRTDPDLIRLHQQHTMIAVWDDHEFANGAYLEGADNHQPGEGDWVDRVAAAKQAYFEWMPVRDNPQQQVYRAFSYGDLCDLLMLDTRMDGREALPEHFDTPDVPVRKMISAAQSEWLITHLKQSDAKWKLIGNQVLFSSLNFGFAAGILDGSPDVTHIDSIRQIEDTFNDTWESYPTLRNNIIDSIHLNDIDNVVILTGDSHMSWAFDVTTQPVLYPLPEFSYLPQPNPFDPETEQGYDPDSGQGSWAVEFGTPSISSPNFDETAGPILTAGFESILVNPAPPFGLEYNPHLRFVDLDRHGYILLDLRPDTAQADFYYVQGLNADNLPESFGAAAYTVNGQNRVQSRNLPATGKTEQCPETPLLPFGMNVAAEEPAQVLNALSLSPNPAQNQAVIQFELGENTVMAANIYNSAGRLIRSERPARYNKGNSRINLDLEGLHTGFYWVTLEKEGRILRVLPLVVD